MHFVGKKLHLCLVFLNEETAYKSPTSLQNELVLILVLPGDYMGDSWDLFIEFGVLLCTVDKGKWHLVLTYSVLRSMCFLGRLYTFRILHYANVFAKHTTKYETLTVHFRISCKLRVLLMPQKNKPQNPLTFRPNANLGVKCEKRGAKCKKGDKISCYTLFVFRISRSFSHIPR